MSHRPFLMIATASMLSLSIAACSDNSNTAANNTMSDSASDSAMAGEDPMGVDTAMGSESAMASGATLAANSHGAMFLTDAMMGDNAEVKLGQLAMQQGSSSAVKAFGQMLVSDHGKHRLDVASLAASMGVPRTDATMPEASAAYNRLKALSGAAFDREFAMHMVKDHKADIAMYQAEANSKDPAPLTGLATKTLPTLKMHLTAAQKLPN